MEIGHTVRALLTGIPHLLLGGRSSVRAGAERLASARLGVRGLPVIIPMDSVAFNPGGPIPSRYTADGDSLTPPLLWRDVPEATRSLVLIAEDPDAPTPQPFVHWIALMPPESRSLGILLSKEQAATAETGRTTLLRTGWVGCAPPRGDSAHHYHFQLFALDRELRHLGSHPGRSALLRQMKGHVLGFGELVGTYQRTSLH
ncbi:YbhB/YbcL family Raf kinase inhibitor-like protein [Cystobacter fuscus]|uniref:YbhB/YbcL family Raf kinase inhibitor-like protein n=1 Tax=Cystobacter fuscus TaxID=43 RepID=UPI002B2E37DA|nr:YbhB/YbcL family Raf kinase inhibitor-like protein [Cystobacter fuscus]